MNNENFVSKRFCNFISRLIFNKKIFLFFLLIIGLCIVTTSCVNNKNQGNNKDNTLKADTLKVAVEESYYPVIWKNSNNEFVGSEADYIRKVGELAGYEIEFQAMSFDKIIDAVANHEVDISINQITITDSRKEKVDFTDSYYQDGQSLFVPINSDITIDSLKESAKTKDVVIACQSGTIFEDIKTDLGFNVKFDTYENIDDCLTAVKNQKATAVIADSSHIFRSNELGIKSLPLNSGAKSEVGIALNKDLKNVKEKLNTAISKLNAENYIDKQIAESREKINAGNWDGKFNAL